MKIKSSIPTRASRLPSSFFLVLSLSSSLFLTLLHDNGKAIRRIVSTEAPLREMTLVFLSSLSFLFLPVHCYFLNGYIAFSTSKLL